MNVLEAELLGMHAGDGTLYRTNRGNVVWELRGGVDEIRYYTGFVAPLLQQIFGVEFTPKHRSGGGRGSFGVQTCNKAVTTMLMRDFPVGEKSSRVRIPQHLMNSTPEVWCAFLRGLFDTDGSICYHGNKGYLRKLPTLEWSTVSQGLFEDVTCILGKLSIAFNTWICKARPPRSKRPSHHLRIGRQKDFTNWRQSISSHNPKHLNKLLGAETSRGVVLADGIPALAAVAQPGTARMDTGKRVPSV